MEYNVLYIVALFVPKWFHGFGTPDASLQQQLIKDQPLLAERRRKDALKLKELPVLTTTPAEAAEVCCLIHSTKAGVQALCSRPPQCATRSRIRVTPMPDRRCLCPQTPENEYLYV
jgi:hypothetical protein